MSQTSSSLRGFFSKARRRESVRLVVFGLLVLAAGARPMPVARAQPAAPDTTVVSKRFHFSLANPGMLCAGRDYPLRATMLVDLSGVGGSNGYNLQDRVVPGISIKSEVQDTSIATITPAQLRSGFLQTDLLATVPFGTVAGLGEVVFTLHAQKAGVTNLYLNATIPGQLTGSTPQVISIGGPFEVKNCKYKITVKGAWKVQYPNLVTRLTEDLHGEITLDDSGHLAGTADVEWNLRSFSAFCSHAHSITLSQAKLDGTQDEFNVSVAVTYDPFEITTVNCASGSHGQIQVPSVTVSVPTTGGTSGLAAPFQVGNEVLQGRANITVVPVPIK